jgi:hypothetical protein
LSFADAKPRSACVIEYQEKDNFKLADFMERLRSVRGELHHDADYIRGRRERNVKQESVDLEKLRVALRQLNRGRLLIIAERAIEMIPSASLDALVGDMIRVPRLVESECAAGSLLAEIRTFYQASLRSEYYQSFHVNSRNCTDKSQGTDAFIAEFDRLMTRWVQAVAEGSQETVREAFELLFSLLRHIDEDPDRIVFFADEAGSWQVPVDWRTVLPVYFKCLASRARGEEFAHEVDRVVSDFCHYWRPDLLAAAEDVANDEQKAALARLPVGEGRRR